MWILFQKIREYNIFGCCLPLFTFPEDKEAIVGTDPDNDEEISRKPTVNEPFSALAFKIATDPFVGRLAFLELIQVT